MKEDLKKLVDCSSEGSFIKSFALIGVISRFGSLADFIDWIEENLQGNEFDEAVCLYASLCEYAANKNKAVIA